MEVFQPKLPESFKGGDLYHFNVRHQELTSITVYQETQYGLRDKFAATDGKVEVKFDVNLASVSITFELHLKNKKIKIKRPVHLID
jgi:hypothetical protein